MRGTFVFLFLLNVSFSFCQVRLPRLISDGMILQRDATTKLWGWATPGEQVILTFNQKEFKTFSDRAGNWSIPLPPQKAGGPYTITLKGKNTVTVKDVLFGDVWVCSGQSNMELPLQRVRYQYPDVIAKANNPFIRQFEVRDGYNFKAPNEDVPAGQWIPATPEHILKFSAVAYFFAEDLYQAYKIPIGLINTALGGSPAEAWISEGALKQFPTHWAELQKFKDQSLIEGIEAGDRQRQNNWYAELNSKDEGLQQGWRNPTLNDGDWQPIEVPGYWDKTPLGKANGAVWFRKEVAVPKSDAGQPAELLLGRIVDADSVFVNGRFVGATSYQYPPRRYTIPAGVLTEGKNVVVVKVISNSGSGGFVPDKPYQLLIKNNTIDLTGTWKYKLGARMEPLPGQTFVRWKPAGLFNAMVAPLVNYSVKGVTWYQGESNTDRWAEYKSLMQTLITDWRTHWQKANLPFLFVQLPNFMEPQPTPAESNWAQLRQAQLETLSLPHTGMAVAIDLGEWNDIHPLNKKDVGKRLALQAKQVAYGNNKITASGPLFQSVQKNGSQLVVHFSNVDGGLVAKGGGALKHFAIAGSDNKFYWANAQIKGNTIVAWSEAVNDPLVIRYAWADNPQGANLYNKAGLPAAPFGARANQP